MISKTLPTATKVRIWTDAGSSQFKNRFVFSSICKLQDSYSIAIEWNFFATSHGKDHNDALGGNVKRMAHRQAMPRHLVITDAGTFSKAVEMVASDSVSVTVMSQADIDRRCSDLGLEELWSSVSVMPGVFNTHCVHVANDQVFCRYYTDGDIFRVHSLSLSVKSPRKSKKARRSSSRVTRVAR